MPQYGTAGSAGARISGPSGTQISGSFGASSAALSTPITFPLERPRIKRRRRRREPVLADASLPYFLCGDENRLLAYAATADISVLRIGNPLVVLGPTGVGKTSVAMHLAARIGIELGIQADADQPAETVYLPASDFARDYAEAIEVNDLPSLQSRLIDAPVLIIDDLDGVAGKDACQEELARRIEQRAELGKMTLITARRSPEKMDHMHRALTSRVMAGMTIPLAYPSDRTCCQLIAEFAIALNIPMQDQWIDHLQKSLPPQTNSRVIESLLKSIELHRRMQGREVDLRMIQTVLDGVPLRKVVSMEKIIRVTGRHFSIATSALRGPSRQKTTVRVRSLAMWLCRKLTETSTHKIGEQFGGRDHTTVMHALAKIDAAMPDDSELRLAVEKIEDRLLV